MFQNQCEGLRAFFEPLGFLNIFFDISCGFVVLFNDPFALIFVGLAALVLALGGVLRPPFSDVKAEWTADATRSAAATCAFASRDAATFSVEEFRREFEGKHPLIIRGATLGWPAHETWTKARLLDVTKKANTTFNVKAPSTVTVGSPTDRPGDQAGKHTYYYRTTAALNAAAAAQRTPQHAAPALRAARGAGRGPALRAAR